MRAAHHEAVRILPAAPRLRASPRRLFASRTAFALWCAANYFAVQQSQAWWLGLSDEPFAIRDVQFNDPGIAIPFGAPGKVFRERVGIFGVLAQRALPVRRRVDAGHPFKKTGIISVISQYDNDGSRVPLTLVEDSRESPFGLSLADQASHFDMCGQARIHASLCPVGCARITFKS